MASTVWVNGRPDGQLDPADRGLAYGDGLFETLRLHAGRPWLAERHWQRLQAGCQRLGLPLDLPALQAAFAAFLASQPSHGVVKMIVSRGPGGRGYLPPEPAQPTWLFSWHALPDYPAEQAGYGIEVGLCRQRLGLSPLLAGLKHLNRLEQVLLRRELAEQDLPEALVLDIEGRVVEGVFSNIFLVQDQALLTPRLDQAGVAGVMRAEIMAWAAVQGISVTEAALSLGDFQRADEVFFCNSVYGVWPVLALPGRDFAQAGPLTRRVQNLIPF